METVISTLLIAMIALYMGYCKAAGDFEYDCRMVNPISISGKIYRCTEQK